MFIRWLLGKKSFFCHCGWAEGVGALSFVDTTRFRPLKQFLSIIQCFYCPKLSYCSKKIVTLWQLYKQIFMKRYYYLYLLICLFSCGEKNSHTENTVEIDFNQSGVLKLSDIADSISYIHLETTDECLIAGGGINFQYKNDIIYVMDVTTKSIFLFKENGKYITKLNKFGQGPGEYLSINSFFADDRGNIHILDLGIKKILLYNSQLEYVSETKIEDFPRSFYLSGNKYMLYMPDKNINCRHGFYALDTRNNEYTKIFDIKENKKDLFMLNSYMANKKDNSYCIVNNYNNEFFFMEGEQLKNVLRFQKHPSVNPHCNPSSRKVVIIKELHF
jgi:hypothetical protein